MIDNNKSHHHALKWQNDPYTSVIMLDFDHSNQGGSSPKKGINITPTLSTKVKPYLCRPYHKYI